MRIVSLDTETSGLDHWHGAAPYIVTSCDGSPPLWWEWDVDPLTRTPIIPTGDIEEIKELIDGADVLVLHNAKFDCHALANIGIDLPWEKVEDTLIASHILASSMKHDLTALADMYLRKNIRPYEKKAHDVCEECRRYCRSRLKNWAIAKRGREDMPSAKDSTWKYDMWLPRALASHLNHPADHPWWTVTSRYANVDSETTWRLWHEMEHRIKQRDLWDIYRKRMRLPPITVEMERRGMTYSAVRMAELREDFEREVVERENVCVNIAKRLDYELELPEGKRNESLTKFCFGWVDKVVKVKHKVAVPVEAKQSQPKGPQKITLKGPKKPREKTVTTSKIVRVTIPTHQCLNLPITKRSNKTGAPSLDRETIDGYIATLEPGGYDLTFVKALQARTLFKTALGFITSYQSFALPVRDHQGKIISHWFVLHPSYNQTGTATLRWTCQNPNAQQLSKKEEANLRYMFGPAPGREWWSMDAKNIELRIPSYEAGEEDLIWIFEHPKDPPYYGSYHLAICDVLHPELFRKHGGDPKDPNNFKTVYESTWYQWVKNGNFAVIYGAQEKKADATYHVKGAYQLIRSRFPKIAKLNDRVMQFAEKHGYVETIPDKWVNPRKGYPLQCERTERNRIKPTIPLNYHVSGTAMDWMGCAMIETDQPLRQWRREGFDGWLIAQIHDEMIFEFPLAADPKVDRDGSNLWRAQLLAGAMEKCGKRIGIPTPVSIERHTEGWNVGVSF